jgi:hypothetical protein
MASRCAVSVSAQIFALAVSAADRASSMISPQHR